MTKNQRFIIYSILYGYADLTKTNTGVEHHNKAWYKHSLEICKFFTKRKKEVFNKSTSELLQRKRKELVSLDADYFKDKEFSSYVCSILLLQYMVQEAKDLELRLRFGHYSFNSINKEIHEMFPSVEIEGHKYVSKVLETIEGVS